MGYYTDLPVFTVLLQGSEITLTTCLSALFLALANLTGPFREKSMKCSPSISDKPLQLQKVCLIVRSSNGNNHTDSNVFVSTLINTDLNDIDILALWGFTECSYLRTMATCGIGPHIAV